MRRTLLDFIAMSIIWLIAADIAHAQGGGEQRGNVYSDTLPLPQISPAKIISGQQASPLFFVDQMTGWILRRSVLYGTRDGGRNWNILNSRDAQRLTKVYFLNEKDGWAIYDLWTTQGRSNRLLSTQDGGRSWKKVREVSTPIYTIFFLNNYEGYFTPRWESIQRTVDGGHTWEKMNSPEGLNYVFFINERTGWRYGASIWHTNDGWQSWIEDTPDEDISDLYGAKFLGEKTGWIVGSEGQVWHKDSGKGWHRITNLPTVGENIYGIDFIGDNEGWITIEDGRVVHTADGGNSWQVIAHRSQALTEIRFIGRDEGWALDSKDNLLHTSDGGKQWRVVRVPSVSRRASVMRGGGRRPL